MHQHVYAHTRTGVPTQAGDVAAARRALSPAPARRANYGSTTAAVSAQTGERVRVLRARACVCVCVRVCLTTRAGASVVAGGVTAAAVNYGSAAAALANIASAAANYAGTTTRGSKIVRTDADGENAGAGRALSPARGRDAPAMTEITAARRALSPSRAHNADDNSGEPLCACVCVCVPRSCVCHTRAQHRYRQQAEVTSRRRGVARCRLHHRAQVAHRHLHHT
jgi:hypothetical protein